MIGITRAHFGHGRVAPSPLCTDDTSCTVVDPSPACVPPSATFTVRLSMPLLARHVPEHRVLTSALYLAALVYLAIPFSRSAAMLMALSFVLGLGLGVGQPMVMALLHSLAPPGRMGEAAGVRMSLMNSMAVAVPLVFGAVGGTIGLSPVLWSVGVFLPAGGFYWRRGVRR